MKILVVFTGGTIGSASKNGIISPSGDSKRTLINNFDNKNNIIFEEAEPYFSLSENNTGENLTKLIACVKANITDYDGIIIAHGTDTLQYSAAALSFALGSDTIPVVLVSANYPLDDKQSNGNDNFTSAVRFIEQQAGNGVFISYKNSNGVCCIHRGSRVMGHPDFSDDLFSVKNQYFGIIDNGEFVKNENYRAVPDEIDPFGAVQLNPHSNIKIINAAVGEAFDYNADCLYLIRAYHSGTLPTADKSLIDFARRSRNIFVSGFDRNSVYESAAVYDDMGFKTLPVSSFVSSYIKLWIAESVGISADDIMYKSLGEDIVPN